MLSRLDASSIASFLPKPMKQRSLNYQNLRQILSKFFLCRLSFQKIETKFVLTYTNINYIFTVSKGQFSVSYYIVNTMILYFIVYCIYVLCLFSACYACVYLLRHLLCSILLLIRKGVLTSVPTRGFC